MSGALASFSAADLGGFAITAALERAGVAPDEVQHVIMGQVLMAGAGQVPSRQAAVKAGIPMNVPSINVNKVCLSGLNSIYLANQMIAAGEADIVVAGGMESMTNAPYLAQGARSGFRYGNTELADSIIKDGLWCAFDECLMGLGTDQYSSGIVSRDQQDSLSATSHERAANAIKDGRLADEIVPVSVPQRRSDPILVETDEGVRPGTTAESLGKLRPAFDSNGTITAGNASLLHQPSRAIMQAAEKAGIAVADLDLFEINEAFAAVGIASIAELGISDEIVNVNGGAVALGHPIGMSGNRLALTLLHEMKRRGGGTGAVALCGGGGQGDAAILRTV